MLKDDNRRLSVSIGDVAFSVVDTLSGEQYVFDGKNVTDNSLDVEIIKDHLQSLQELLSLARANYFGHKPLGAAGTDKITVQEVEHFTYKITCNRRRALLHDDILDCGLGFNQLLVLNKINYVYSVLLRSNTILCPQTDIVRRVVDARLLVWVHNGNTAVCFEENCIGQSMIHCLINGTYYEQVPLSVDEEKGIVSMFDGNFNFIAEFPVDKSVLVYFQDDSKLLEEEEGT